MWMSVHRHITEIYIFSLYTGGWGNPVNYICIFIETFPLYNQVVLNNEGVSH